MSSSPTSVRVTPSSTSTLTQAPAQSGGGTVRPSTDGRDPRTAPSSDRDHRSGKDTPCCCCSLETRAYLRRRPHGDPDRNYGGCLSLIRSAQPIPRLGANVSIRFDDLKPLPTGAALLSGPPMGRSECWPGWPFQAQVPQSRQLPTKRHSHVKFSSWAGTLKQSPVAKTSSTSGKLKPYLFPDVHSSL